MACGNFGETSEGGGGAGALEVVDSSELRMSVMSSDDGAAPVNKPQTTMPSLHQGIATSRQFIDVDILRAAQVDRRSPTGMRLSASLTGVSRLRDTALMEFLENCTTSRADSMDQCESRKSASSDTDDTSAELEAAFESIDRLALWR